MTSRMSAEPAIPAQPCLNAVGPADVISIDKHRRTSSGHPNARGRRGTMNTTPPPEDSRPPTDADTALADWADSIEKSFLETKQSLTDPRTRAAFLRTLDVWERALQGTHAQGIIDDQQLGKLLEILNWMRHVPGLV